MVGAKKGDKLFPFARLPTLKSVNSLKMGQILQFTYFENQIKLDFPALQGHIHEFGKVLGLRCFKVTLETH